MAAAQSESVSQLELVSEFLQMKLSSDIKVKLVDEKENLGELIEKLKSCKLFAFDCESVGLGRNHPISLMNLAFEDGSIYLVDVQKLGFPDEFQTILEDPDTKKVMFDCRADADCLKHQHQVMLKGVVDMQIMEYVIIYPNLEVANKLPAFYDLVAKYMNAEKEKYLRDLKPKDMSDWGVRPLKESLLKYASFEIGCFLKVKEDLMKKWIHGESRIIEWSEKYASSHKDDPSFDDANPYKSHRFMPFNILETAPYGSISCTDCEIYLPESEFSKNQLKKKVQKCKVCKAVKLEKDVQKNREDNRWRRHHEDDLHDVNESMLHENYDYDDLPYDYYDAYDGF